MSTTTIAPTSSTDNQATISTPVSQQEPGEAGRITRSNQSNFQKVDFPNAKIQSFIDMRYSNNLDPKLETLWAAVEHTPTLIEISAGAIEAQKARASGDEIEADDDEESSVVEDEHAEDVSGGRRVSPTHGLGEEF